MADAHYKPSNIEREQLAKALGAEYEFKPLALHFAVSNEFESAFAIQFNFHDLSIAIPKVMDALDTRSTEHWRRFLLAVRRKSVSTDLFVAVESILLSGSLAGIRGHLEQISGLGGAVDTAFAQCQPEDTQDGAGLPPQHEGTRIAWYAGRLVPAGRLTQAGRIPLLRYVEQIRRAVEPGDPPLGARLAQWIEGTAALVAVNDDDRKRILDVTRRPPTKSDETRAQTRATGERVVFFQIRPARDTTRQNPQYSLQAWLMSLDGSDARSLWASTAPWNSERVVQLLSARSSLDQPPEENAVERSPLDEIRDRLAEEGVHYETVRVELVLPLSFVWHEPDQAPVMIDEASGWTVLGAAHILAVRVWERQLRLRSSMAVTIQNLFSTEEAAPCWLVRDKSPGDPPDEDPPANALRFLWVDETGPTGHELTYRLRDGGFVGCVVGLDPSELPEPERTNFLRSITGANVPIIVWSRKCPADRTALWKCFRDLFHERPLHTWPRRVFEKRRAPGAEPQNVDWHPGRYLSLIWEDPRRRQPNADPSRAGTPQ